MRATALNLLAILLTAAGGVAVCNVLGRDPHVRDLIAAAIAALLATQLAMVPLILTRRASQIAVAQAGLVATIVHMMLAATFAAAVVLGRLPFGQAFLYWLLVLYWVTLIVVVAECIGAVKRALPETSPKH